MLSRLYFLVLKLRLHYLVLLYSVGFWFCWFRGLLLVWVFLFFNFRDAKRLREVNYVLSFCEGVLFRYAPSDRDSILH